MDGLSLIGWFVCLGGWEWDGTSFQPCKQLFRAQVFMPQSLSFSIHGWKSCCLPSALGLLLSLACHGHNSVLPEWHWDFLIFRAPWGSECRLSSLYLTLKNWEGFAALQLVQCDLLCTLSVLSSLSLGYLLWALCSALLGCHGSSCKPSVPLAVSRPWKCFQLSKAERLLHCNWWYDLWDMWPSVTLHVGITSLWRNLK